MKKAISTNGAPAAIGPYSQAIDCGEFVFTSGQLGLDPATGKLVDGGVQAQATQAMKNIQAVLTAAGRDISLRIGELICGIVFRAARGMETEARESMYASLYRIAENLETITPAAVSRPEVELEQTGGRI